MIGAVEPWPPAVDEADAPLWDAFTADRNGADREALFNIHCSFARQIANRHFHSRNGEIELSDLLQLACTGLLEAIDRYDPDRGVPFRSYAARRITGSILDGIAKMSEVREQAHHRNRIRNERSRSLAAAGTEPDDAEAALRLVTDMTIGLALGFMLEGTSLYGGEEGRDHRPDAYESLAWKQTIERLEQEVAALPEREKLIIRHHYGGGMSFAQLGDLFSLSKGRISQLHRSALDLLRKRLLDQRRFTMRR